MNNSGCFVAGTEVLTGSSSSPVGTFSQTPIQDIQVGDEVLTRDQNDPNAPLQEEQVTQVMQHTVYVLSDVSIQDANGQTEVIRATPQHPFYVDGLGWTGASQLIAGKQLEQPDGSAATVVSVTGESDPQGVAVYNFTVAADHTYFVDQGGDAVWVHNNCDVDPAMQEDLNDYKSECANEGGAALNKEEISTLKQLQNTATQTIDQKGKGSGHAYGSQVHKIFADKITALNDPNLKAEVSFNSQGRPANYGDPGSIRLDAVEYADGKIVAVYDLKTGGGSLLSARIARIRDFLGIPDLPVLEVRGTP